MNPPFPTSWTFAKNMPQILVTKGGEESNGMKILENMGKRQKTWHTNRIHGQAFCHAIEMSFYSQNNSKPNFDVISKFRSLRTTPISGKTLSEWKGHSRSSRRIPGYSRSSSRNSETDSRNAKFHSRNALSRLEQYENHNSRSNSRSDSRNWWEPTWKIFICPMYSRSVFSRIGVAPARKINGHHMCIEAFCATEF